MEAKLLCNKRELVELLTITGAGKPLEKLELVTKPEEEPTNRPDALELVELLTIKGEGDVESEELDDLCRLLTRAIELKDEGELDGEGKADCPLKADEELVAAADGEKEGDGEPDDADFDEEGERLTIGEVVFALLREDVC